MKGFEAMKVGVCLWWILMLSSSCAMGQCHPKDLNALMVRWQVLSTETHDLMTSVHAQFADVNMQLAELSKQISRQDNGFKKEMNGATLQISKIETQLRKVVNETVIHNKELEQKIETQEQNLNSIQANLTKIENEQYILSDQIDGITKQSNLSLTDMEKLKKELENLESRISSINAKVEIAFVVHTPPSLALTQNATIQFKTVILNNGSGYDAGSGKFTATVAGTYMFSAQICGYHRSSIVYQIVVNGVPYSASEQYEHDKVGACSSVVTVASLNTGAIVWVKCVSSESKLFIDNNQWNMFSGMLINARI